MNNKIYIVEWRNGSGGKESSRFSNKESAMEWLRFLEKAVFPAKMHEISEGN